MKNLMYTAAVLTLASNFATPAHADEATSLLSKDRFQVRLRAIDVIPDEDSSVNIGGEVGVDDSVMPEVDVTYFLTDHIGAELIAATTKHNLDYTGGVDLGETWVLPPTLTLQYHFTPDSKFSPYVGAGVNYTIFYSEKAGPGFTDLNIDNGVGLAAQAGFDYWVNDN
jgi:outer membrane protein